MSAGTAKIGFCFSIGSLSQARIVPVEKKIANAFDFASGLVSTERIEGERNADYRTRVFDVAVHPAGPLYEGVINGIARDFGFIRQRAIQIDLKTASSGENIAENPRVDILANRVVLYRDWSSPTDYTIDKEVYFYSRDSEGYYLEDLVTAINSSDCFTASRYPGVRSNMHSFLLVRGTSTTVVLNDLVRADYMTRFKMENITEGTLWFEEKDIFTTEVSGDPTAVGEYRVNYRNGWVRTYKIPSGTGRCGYRAATFPLKVDWLPIQVYNLHDENFIEELHRQETLPDGDTVNGLPNGEGAEIYHQLFKETNTFWGE